MNNLLNIFHLSSVVEVFVPSTLGVATLNAGLHETYKRETMLTLSELFGGATVIESVGCYKANDGQLVTEPISIVQSYTNTVDLEKHIGSVLNLCENLKAKMQQESIALKVNGKLYFI